MNIIIQALKDSEDLLKSMRKYADSQEREKLDAFCTHLRYLASTTVVSDDPLQAVQEQIKQGTLTPDEAITDTRAKPEAPSHPSEAYLGRDGEQIIRWVPEAPDYSLYAYEPKNAMDKRNCTHNIHDALQFKFRQQCVDWCERHPVPKFIPMERAFMGEGSR